MKNPADVRRRREGALARLKAGVAKQPRTDFHYEEKYTEAQIKILERKLHR